MNGEVLEAGGGGKVNGINHLGIPQTPLKRVAVLQSVNASQPHLRGEKRVLAVGLHAAAPARVTEDVDVGGEKGESRIIAVIAGGLRLVVLLPRLERGVCKSHPYQGRGKGGGEGDGHRPDGGGAVATHTVQGLVPPAVLLQPEPLDGRVVVLHQRELFVQSELGDKKLHPLSKRITLSINFYRQ